MWFSKGEEQKVPKKIESCSEFLITSGKPCQRNRKVLRFPAQTNVISASATFCLVSVVRHASVQN